MELGRNKDIKEFKPEDKPVSEINHFHIDHRDRLADKAYIGDSHENNTSKIYGEKIEKQEDKPEKNSVNNEYKNVSEVSHITAEDPDKSNSKELDANIPDKLQESLKSFEQLTWKDLPLEQKMETISEFSDLISEDRELENKPKIEFYSGGEKNDLTTYSPEDHTIYINEDSNN